ncbi:DUF4380 domain-containing protein [bacterium]|nr:DUF4380 domain-containing protein [bacterium]
MRSRKQLLSLAILILVVLMYSCSGDKKSEQKAPAGGKQIVIAQEGFHGWKSATLRTTFAQVDVVPELGGKIMGYDLRGFQILWHDPKREGELYKTEGYGFGESFFNPGGAKVWPAPQGWSGKDEWPGPPDNVLDGSPYEYTANDKSITVTSPADTGEGRTGLQYTNTYAFKNTSSLLDLHMTMKNVVQRPVKWGIWHLATVPVDRPVTVYAPVDKDGWHVIFGDKDNPQWLGVEKGMFRARYDKRVGKIGLKVREGWVAWHDEQNNAVFVMMFPVKKGIEYPDNGSNVEIWTNGAGTYRANNRDFQTEYSPDTANMELEVMGPLTRLAPGESSALDVTWGACFCSGVVKVVSHGVVAEELHVEDGMVKGKFGVFYGGYLQVVYLDKNGKQKGYKNVQEISPLSEVIIDQEYDKVLSFGSGIRYQILPYGESVPGVLGELMFK